MDLSEIFSKSVFLLGAGATREAGCATSNEMLLKLEENILREGNELEEEVYYFLCACLSYQNSLKNSIGKSNTSISNIEDFIFLLRKIINRDFYLPHPLVGNWSEKIQRFENKDEDIFKKILLKIEHTYLPQWLNFQSKKQEELLNPIMTFFKETTDEEYTLNMFTLNYDLVYETYFNNTELILNDGFTSNTWNDNFDHSKEEKDAGKYRINYYKMHGSLNWEKDPDDPDSMQTVKTDEDKNSLNPLIIFGQEAKMLSIDPFLSLTSRFKSRLENANFYFIIGYSFFDTYINNLLLESVNKSIERRLIVVGPNEEKSQKISDKLAAIQKSDLGNIYNAIKVSPNRIVPLTLTAGKFYQKYFSNKGKELIKLVTDITKPDEPFSIK